MSSNDQESQKRHWFAAPAIAPLCVRVFWVYIIGRCMGEWMGALPKGKRVWVDELVAEAEAMNSYIEK